MQWSQKDPAPGKLDSYFNTTSSSPVQPTTIESQAGYFASDTVAGNALLCIATIANDFGTGPDPAGNKLINISDPYGNWTKVGELLNNTTDCNCDIVVYVKFNAPSLKQTAWSGTASCSGGILTLGSGSGNFQLNQLLIAGSITPPTVAGAEVCAVNLRTGTLGAVGSTYDLNGNGSSLTFTSQAMTTKDFVAVQRNITTNPPVADYPGLFLVELSGTDNTSVYFAGANTSIGGAGTDTLSSGALTMPASGGILFGYGFNGGVNGGAAGAVVPAAGTGFLTSNGILTYDQQTWTGPICLVEWQRFSSLGSRAATFSPNHASNMAALGVGFSDHP